MGDENVLELASVDGSQTCEYTKKNHWIVDFKKNLCLKLQKKV